MRDVGGISAFASPDGKADAEIPPTSRIYFIFGLAHIGGAWPPTHGAATDDELWGTNLRNPNNYWNVTHGLVDVMDAWVRHDVELFFCAFHISPMGCSSRTTAFFFSCTRPTSSTSAPTSRTTSCASHRPY